MNLKNIPSEEITQPFNYFYPGLNTLTIIKGKAKIAKSFEGKILSIKISANSIEKLPVDNDIINQIASYSSTEENTKILCTFSFKLAKGLRNKIKVKFLFALAEDESRWYNKKSIINFKQTISKFEVSPHILKSIPHYLRAEGEEIKSLIAFTKTVEAWKRSNIYGNYIQEQLLKIK